MAVHPIAGEKDPAFTGHDRMTAFIFGRLQVVESCLMIMANESGKFAEIKTTVSKLVEALEKTSKASEHEKASVDRGHRTSLDAIFHEFPTA